MRVITFPSYDTHLRFDAFLTGLMTRIPCDIDDLWPACRANDLFRGSYPSFQNPRGAGDGFSFITLSAHSSMPHKVTANRVGTLCHPFRVITIQPALSNPLLALFVVSLDDHPRLLR